MYNTKFENIRIKFLIHVSGLLLGLCAISSTSAASFDCTKASSRIDNAICASPNLSQLDSDLASAYRTAMSSSSDAAALKAVQIAWLKGTRNQCQDDDCLATVYAQRIAALKIPVQMSEVKVVTTNDPADQLYLADRTATLAATEVSEINKILSKLNKSGLVVAIHIFENTGVESISEVADRIGNNWIEGPDHARPQMVLALSKSDRKLRISVNNEISSIFPDSETRSIIDEAMTPALKDGNTGKAILLALNRMDTTLTLSNATAVVQQSVPPSESASSTSSVTTTAKNLDINSDSNQRVIEQNKNENAEIAKQQNNSTSENSDYAKRILNKILITTGFVLIILTLLTVPYALYLKHKNECIIIENLTDGIVCAGSLLCLLVVDILLALVLSGLFEIGDNIVLPIIYIVTGLWVIAHLYWMYVVSARSNDKSFEIWTITIARITLSLLVIIYFVTRGSGSSVNYSRSENESDVGYEMRIQREEQQAISSRKSADQANTRNGLLLAALFGLVIHKYGFESPGAYFKRRNIFGLSSV